MDALTSVDSEKWNMVNKPVLMSESTFHRLTNEGGSTNWWALQLVTEGKNIVDNKLSDDQSGIVLGSGDNTQEWKTKGWFTCDINPKFNPDIVVDANDLDERVVPNSQDCLFAECLRFDSLSRNGVSPSRLLNQANKLLREGGILVIETANFEGIENTNVPKRDRYLSLMAKHGFNAVAEVFPYYDMGGGKLDQKVIYYGKKVVDGYNKDLFGDI